MFLLNVPVVLIGIIAVTALVPESLAAQRPGLDPIGMASSSAGLVAVTYGLITAGQDGWTNVDALLFMAAGILVLVEFFQWERRLSRRPDGQPLLDLTLFQSASFMWGVIIAAVAVLAMIGGLFTMPQYFQGVLGTDAMGSGIRLLPLIAGLVVGAVPADRLAGRLGAKVTVALGFTLLAVGFAFGSFTRVASSGAFVAGWMAIVGLGMGLAMATSAAAALTELSEERSGVGSAVLQAVNKVGGPFGTAILGAVLTSGYLSRIDVSALPPDAATVVRESIFGDVAVSERSGSASLLESVRTAFVHGMDTSLLAATGIAVVGFVLALLFLPQGNTHAETR